MHSAYSFMYLTPSITSSGTLFLNLDSRLVLRPDSSRRTLDASTPRVGGDPRTYKTQGAEQGRRGRTVPGQLMVRRAPRSGDGRKVYMELFFIFVGFVAIGSP